MRARGYTRRSPGKMNGLERDWSLHLQAQKHAGEIVEWWFEPVSLRLGQGASYKPDFMVVCADGLVEFHETKGHMREAANVRLKVAADKFPQFVFRLIKQRSRREGGGLEITVIGPEL